MDALNTTSSVGVRELRQEASALIRRVKNGEIVEITEHGTPVARLVPIQESEYEDWIVAQLLRASKKPNSLGKIKPFKLPSGVSASNVLLKMRAEERF